MTTPTAEQRDESELIRAICAGETEHFYSLVRPYERMVYFTAFGVLGNASDAEDATQEAFLKALRGLSTFRAESKFSTWLVQIAFNESRMVLRRKRATQYESLDSGKETDEGDFLPRDFADWREIPSEALARKELRETLMGAVAGLKNLYREVLILRDVRHLSVRETAELLGVSSAVVKTRLLRARLQLREVLAPGYDGAWSADATEYRKVRLW